MIVKAEKYFFKEKQILDKTLEMYKNYCLLQNRSGLCHTLPSFLLNLKFAWLNMLK